MKVYILMSIPPFESKHYIEGVYATKEKAQEAKAVFEYNNYIDCYIDEYFVEE